MSLPMRALFLFAIAALLPPVSTAEGEAPHETFTAVWTENPSSEEISKETLDLIMRYVAEGDATRQQQLQRVYESDKGKFWTEVRQFLRDNPPEAANTGDGQGQALWWQEELQAQQQKFLAWLKEAYPERERQLTKLGNADEYWQRFGALYKKYGTVAATQNRNPELAAVLKEDLDLVDKRDELLAQIRKANRWNRPKLTKELEEVVSKRFDLIVLKKHLQYDELRRRIEGLRRELESKEHELGRLIQSKDEITKQHLQELLAPPVKVGSN